MSDSETTVREVTPVDYVVLTDVLQDVGDEVDAAFKAHSNMNSLHEAYAVILEELIEFQQEVFKRRSKRDIQALRKEAIQIAAMSIRAIIDVIDPLIEVQGYNRPAGTSKETGDVIA